MQFDNSHIQLRSLFVFKYINNWFKECLNICIKAYVTTFNPPAYHKQEYLLPNLSYM